MSKKNTYYIYLNKKKEHIKSYTKKNWTQPVNCHVAAGTHQQKVIA